MRVEMLTTAASPERILESGKTYDIPRGEASVFIEEGFAKLAANGAKLTRLPAQPDPEDVPEFEEDDSVLGDDDE